MKQLFLEFKNKTIVIWVNIKAVFAILNLAIAEIILGLVLIMLPFCLLALGYKISNPNTEFELSDIFRNVVELKDIIVLSITLSTGAAWLLIRHKPDSVLLKLVHTILLICIYGAASYLYGSDKIDGHVANNENNGLVNACIALGIASLVFWAWSTAWRCILEDKERNEQKKEGVAIIQTQTRGRDNKKRAALTKSITGFNSSKPHD